MIELLITTYAMFGITATAVLTAYKLNKKIHSDEYRNQVFMEVAKERHGLGSSDVR